jgi:excisionase family DNA binding protein
MSMPKRSSDRPEKNCSLQSNMRASNDIKSTSEALLTVTDVMDLFRVSKSSVYRMIEQRLVPFFKIKSGLRFQRSDIDAYLAQCRTEAINEHEYGSSKN